MSSQCKACHARMTQKDLMRDPEEELCWQCLGPIREDTNWWRKNVLKPKIIKDWKKKERE